ncbi:MAG: DUF3298 and DUF4163 domain-containing protein [Sporolactobacillus sp.]
MKKFLLVPALCLMALVFVFGTEIGVSTVQAATRVHAHIYYSTKVQRGFGAGYAFIKYPQISGLKNEPAQRRVNQTLKHEAIHFYNVRKVFLKQNPTFKADGEISKSQGGLSYKIRYLHGNRLSVEFSENLYSGGGAHGSEDTVIYNFDLTSGNTIALRSNFKSPAAYTAANHYAQTYMKKHSDQYPFAFQNGTTNIYHHYYYWTAHGLRVEFQEYEVAAYAAGHPTVFIPEKYLTHH